MSSVGDLEKEEGGGSAKAQQLAIHSFGPWKVDETGVIVHRRGKSAAIMVYSGTSEPGLGLSRRREER